MKTEITAENFKLIKSFDLDFKRADGIRSNRYLIDWNSIMPTVHKILKTTYPPKGQGWPYSYIQLEAARVGNSLTYIIYRVIEFIKWYNDSHPKAVKK